MEDEGVAVGAGRRIADHLRFETITVQAAGETQRLCDGLRDLGAERDLRRRAAGHVHAPEFALAPDHHRLRIRRPAVVRIGAEDRPDFLLVVREAVPDRADFAGFEVEHVQHGLVAHALDEGQRFAVGRGLRPDGAARGVHHRARLAGLAVEALDRVDHAMHVLVVFEGAAAADVFRVIDVAAIGTHGRFAEVHLVVLALGQLQAAGGAAVDRIHPQFAGAERALRGEMLAADQVLAIRRPHRIVEQAEILLRHLRRAAAVAIHAPQVVAAAAVGGVGDLFAVGRETRLHVPGRAAADAGGVAAADRQGVNVPEHRKRDRAAVGADVEIEPGAFVGAELDRLRWAVGGVHVPLGFVCFVGGADSAGERKSEGEGERMQFHGGVPEDAGPAMRAPGGGFQCWYARGRAPGACR